MTGKYPNSCAIMAIGGAADADDDGNVRSVAVVVNVVAATTSVAARRDSEIVLDNHSRRDDGGCGDCHDDTRSKRKEKTRNRIERCFA